MRTGSIQPNEEFQCPLCLVNNRAAAKFCRKCGRPRDVLKKYVESPAFETVAFTETAAVDQQYVDETPDANDSKARETDSTNVIHVAARQPHVQANPECPGCSSIVRTSDRFCCWCGEVQPMRVERHFKTCSNCSQSLPARANFCFECGHADASAGNLRMRVPTELFGEESSEFFPTFEA
jgi:membrane protease subunit (stomatin/prohibitin family)